jgi:hypothetical protein
MSLLVDTIFFYHPIFDRAPVPCVLPLPPTRVWEIARLLSVRLVSNLDVKKLTIDPSSPDFLSRRPRVSGLVITLAP